MIMLNFLGFNLLGGKKKEKPHHTLQELFDHERNLCERVGWDLCLLSSFSTQRMEQFHPKVGMSSSSKCWSWNLRSRPSLSKAWD